MPLFADADILAAATAAFGATAAPFVAWVTKRLFAKLSAILHKFDAIGEKVEAVEEKVDSVAERVKRIEPVADRMEKEFTPNGGSSLRDVINLIDRRVTILAGQHRARFEGDGLATYECDADGLCTYASAALAEMYGLAPEAFLGNGWLRAVKGAQARAGVWHRWLQAVKDGIPYEDVYDVQTPTGVIRVRTYTRAVKDKDGRALCYFGMVTLATDSKIFDHPPAPAPAPLPDDTGEHEPLPPA